jgi:hypothetical protein
VDLKDLRESDMGNAYLGGGFGQTLDFGGGTTPLVALTSDAFVAKIGAAGQTLWAQRFGWAGETWANGGSGYVYSIAIAPGKCAYGSECCICIPTPCGGQSTTWTCTTLAAPAPGCPASPPADGVACSTSGLECTYCASGGRQLATCTAAG